MGYTLRQIAGWLHFCEATERRRKASELSIGFMAARGDPKDVNKTLKDWSKE